MTLCFGYIRSCGSDTGLPGPVFDLCILLPGQPIVEDDRYSQTTELPVRQRSFPAPVRRLEDEKLSLLAPLRTLATAQ